MQKLVIRGLIKAVGWVDNTQIIPHSLSENRITYTIAQILGTS